MSLTNDKKSAKQPLTSTVNPLQKAPLFPLKPKDSGQNKPLSNETYKIIKRAVIESSLPEKAVIGRTAFRQKYKYLTDFQKQEFAERYEKETGRSFSVVLLQMSVGNTFQVVGLGDKKQKEAQASSGSAKGQPEPFIGPTIPSEKVSIKDKDWLTSTKEFKFWSETVFVTGQGAMIEGIRKTQGCITAESLEKTGKFFQQTGYGLYITGEILEIGSLSKEALNKNADPARLRRAIVCLTVKSEFTIGVTELGGALGAMIVPAAPITAPAGAIIFGLTADKIGNWVIEKVDWCKL